jgi:hypothetical protein
MADWQSIEEVDLEQVSERLRGMFEHNPPHGYLRGKTAMRDAVEAALHCSELEAEELVDTLESRGFLRFDGDPSERSEADSTWLIETDREE